MRVFLVTNIRLDILLNRSDFENALQVAAAHACGADCIVTRNIRDFKDSSILVYTPASFLAHHNKS